MYHTLGQRKGLGIGGTKEGSEDPWYVVDKDVANNILIVAQGHDHPRLMSVGLIAQQLHWVDREPVRETVRCTVKTRYRQTDIPALSSRWTMNASKCVLTNRSRRSHRASQRCFTRMKSASAAGSLSNACRCRFNRMQPITLPN